MRHCRPAKQRVWLGAGRYPCRCPRALAHANAVRAAKSNGYSYSYCYSHRNSYTNIDTSGYSDANAYCKA
jgi:hypothetical protein